MKSKQKNGPCSWNPQELGSGFAFFFLIDTVIPLGEKVV